MQRIFSRRFSAVSDRFILQLPSCIRGLQFTAEFELVWTPLVPSIKQCNLVEAARAAAEEEATRVSRTMPVTRITTAECHINARLGRLGDCAGGEVHFDTASVHLSVPAEIARMAEDHEHRLRAQELKDEIQRHELDRLNKFQKTVLADPATAMAYWFMNHPNQLESTIYDKIEDLTKKINSYDPGARSLEIAKLIDKFISDLTTEDKRALIRLLTGLMAGFGHRDEAYRIAAILDPAIDASNQKVDDSSEGAGTK